MNGISGSRSRREDTLSVGKRRTLSAVRIFLCFIHLLIGQASTYSFAAIVTKRMGHLDPWRNYMKTNRVGVEKIEIGNEDSSFHFLNGLKYL